MDANELADRVARQMLAAEGTGPAWGIQIEEIREAYARVSMVIRADMLNVLNHIDLVDVATGITGSNFGQLIGATDPRIIQFHVRLAF